VLLLLAAACANATAASRNLQAELAQQIARGDAVAVRTLLAQGADPNHKSHGQWPLLTGPASNGDVEIIRALLDAGARVNAKTPEGSTALLLAAERGHTEAVKVLLAAKSETDTAVFMNGGGRTPLMHALSAGNVEMARALLEAGASVFVTTSYGATALRFAMWHDSPEMRQIVRRMLAAGAEVDAGRSPAPPRTVDPLAPGQASIDVARAIRNAEGTALGDIAARGSAEMARILLDAGARVDARQMNWTTPLMLAATAGNAPVVRLLLEAGADVHARDATGQTALDLAIARDRHEIVQLLRDAGIDRAPGV
jgi:ankyrin repeat protein